MDEPRVGAALAESYWAPGNGAAFLDLVQKLTGAPLSGDAWVAHLQQPLQDVIAAERKEYEHALQAGPARPAGAGADLNMRVIMGHGDETISDSGPPGGADAAARLAAANGVFKAWVRARFFGEQQQKA